MSEEIESNKQRSWFERLSDLLIREPKDRQQLMEMLRDAEERDILSSEILSMIESVLQLSEMQVREVMIPRSQMIVVEKDCPLETLLPIVINSGHSRFPVMDNDDVIGILLAKDLLTFGFQKNTQDFLMQTIMRSPFFVPQSKRLDILLRESRVNRNHMAIVIDEYGRVAGLITIEDVLEQIVGDIEDEHDVDDEDDDIKKHEDGSYTVKAAIDIDDFNEYFSTEFNDDEFDTMAGLIAKAFGHLPKRGEMINVNHFRFKVLHSDNRRIHLLEVRKE